MKIHIPKFEPILKANEHLAHGAFDIDLGENVVAIVRCKDCWKDGTPSCAMQFDCDCGFMNSWNQGDDFCSWGERKGEKWNL